MWNLIINRGEKVALQVNTIPDETDEKTIFNMLYKCGFISMNRYSGSSSESYYYWDSAQGGFFRPGFIDINKNDIIEINYNELKNRLDQFKK